MEANVDVLSPHLGEVEVAGAPLIRLVDHKVLLECSSGPALTCQ